LTSNKPKKDKFESIIKQDLFLLAVGVIILLVSFTGIFGELSLITLIVGDFFVLFSAIDILRVSFKATITLPIQEI
jgi:hypothetical protein